MTDNRETTRPDIVARLRDPSLGSPRWADTMAEAADEIERLRARMAELEGAIDAAKASILAADAILVRRIAQEAQDHD